MAVAVHLLQVWPHAGGVLRGPSSQHKTFDHIYEMGIFPSFLWRHHHAHRTPEHALRNHRVGWKQRLRHRPQRRRQSATPPGRWKPASLHGRFGIDEVSGRCRPQGIRRSLPGPFTKRGYRGPLLRSLELVRQEILRDLLFVTLPHLFGIRILVGTPLH